MVGVSKVAMAYPGSADRNNAQRSHFAPCSLFRMFMG
jgi:hypothetical protein